jgi:aryl-alcohol dehydrogenase-like predicted oxidoreductase
LDAGCNFLDNAEVYCAGEAEICMGQVLKRLNVPRSELVISTKVFWGGPGTVFSLSVTSVMID